MNQFSNNSQNAGKLSRGQSAIRILGGATMIFIAMFSQGPLGTVAVLPLLAVYPIMTGLMGVDPIYLLWQRYTGVRSEFNIYSRSLLVSSSAVLIGSVMAGEGELGWHGILALIAVYPALAAILGKDPMNGFVFHPQDNIVPLRTIPVQRAPVRKAA